MKRLSIAERVRIVKLAFQAECCLMGKTHLYRMATYAVLPLNYAFLPDSAHACEDIGRRALREMLAENRGALQ